MATTKIYTAIVSNIHPRITFDLLKQTFVDICQEEPCVSLYRIPGETLLTAKFEFYSVENADSALLLHEVVIGKGNNIPILVSRETSEVPPNAVLIEGAPLQKESRHVAPAPTPASGSSSSTPGFYSMAQSYMTPELMAELQKREQMELREKQESETRRNLARDEVTKVTSPTSTSGSNSSDEISRLLGTYLPKSPAPPRPVPVHLQSGSPQPHRPTSPQPQPKTQTNTPQSQPQPQPQPQPRPQQQSQPQPQSQLEPQPQTEHRPLPQPKAKSKQVPPRPEPQQPPPKKDKTEEVKSTAQQIPSQEQPTQPLKPVQPPLIQFPPQQPQSQPEQSSQPPQEEQPPQENESKPTITEPTEKRNKGSQVKNILNWATHTFHDFLQDNFEDYELSQWGKFFCERVSAKLPFTLTVEQQRLFLRPLIGSIDSDFNNRSHHTESLIKLCWALFDILLSRMCPNAEKSEEGEAQVPSEDEIKALMKEIGKIPAIVRAIMRIYQLEENLSAIPHSISSPNLETMSLPALPSLESDQSSPTIQHVGSPSTEGLGRPNFNLIDTPGFLSSQIPNTNEASEEDLKKIIEKELLSCYFSQFTSKGVSLPESFTEVTAAMEKMRGITSNNLELYRTRRILKTQTEFSFDVWVEHSSVEQYCKELEPQIESDNKNNNCILM